MGQAGARGKGWISVRPPMDGPSRARIVLGTVAVLVAALASLALLNVLLEEPLPVGQGDGDQGGDPGGGGPIIPRPDEGQGEEGGQEQRKDDPCQPGLPLVRGGALASTIVAMGLWVLAVWWRQKRQTRVMNGWAIGALLVTLVATTLMFAWWIVHKVCNLDVFNLKSCLEIAHSLRNVFFLFLVMALGLLGYAFMRFRGGQRFWGLWSISGSIFVYLSVLGLIGWLVAEDMCERQFPDDVPEPPNQPNQPDPSNETDGDTGNQGGNPGGGGLGGGNGGGRGGGGAAPVLPQVSPFALLVLLGIAAVITIIVLAVKGRQDQQRAAAMAAMKMGGPAGMLRLFMDTDVESNDAVVATYRRFLDHCMLQGVPKNAHETPREHGKRAAKQLGLPEEEMIPLLDAYTHIRLAQGPLPEERRQAALTSRLWRPKARRVRKGGRV